MRQHCWSVMLSKCTSIRNVCVHTSLIKVKLTVHRCHHYVKKSMGPKLKINKSLAI